MIKTGWENLSEEECVMRLVDGLALIDQIHKSGSYCYDRTEDWRRTRYAWHNPLLPPEYRRSCLSGKAFTMNPSCDFYYFTACYYEKMTGCRAPYNFGIDRSWKGNLKKRMRGWNLENQEMILHLIEKCTRTRRCGS